MRQRLTSNRFVGRVGELAELELAAREASGGRPALVLLGGESGVGKTRLVAEFEARVCAAAEADGDCPPLFLRGAGVDQGGGELPYAPLLGALRPLVRERHPALAGLSAGSRSQLATLLPGLEDETRAADRRSDPSDQLRLFEALLELIDRLSEAAPVVLILEDMHWSDRSTRTFAAFLARTLRHERVCVVLTYRADELHRRHPLRPLLSELERLERARRVDLEPFDRDELDEALTDILGARPEPGLLARLFARSEGNPLYTEELLAAGLDGRGAAPQSLRDAFLLRIERLAPDAQRVARAVAVARTADQATLAVVCDLDRDRVQPALRDAVAEQVLIPGSDGEFCFRHALLREALYDDLLPGERGELHIALARALEERDAGAPDGQGELERASAVASHYAAAGDQPNALRSTLVAARLAHAAYAFGETADLVDRALELWPRVPEAAAVAGVDHTGLLVMAAEAHRMVDDRPRSLVLINEALAEIDPEREPGHYAELLARQARMTWALNRGPEAVEIAERALTMLGPSDDRVRPRLLAWLARSQFLRGRFRESVRDGEPALRTAMAAGDTVAETELLNTLGMARVALGDVEAGVELLRRAQQVARANQDFDSLTTAYTNLADMLSVAGRTGEALAVAREGAEATPRHHMQSHSWARLTVASMAFEAGDWELARASLSPVAPREAGRVFMFARLQSADFALAVGDEEAAEACLEAVGDLVAVSAEPQWIGAYGAVLGELLVRRRDLEGAQGAVQRALDRLEVCTDDVMRIARVTTVGLQVEADRAQRARDLGEPAVRRDALARARIHHDRLAAAAQEGGPVEQARLAQGGAELARARGRAAHREWAKAAAAWEAVQRPYPAAVARWRQADALAGAGDRVAAAEAAAAALVTARKLGSRWLAGEVRALADRARLELAAGNGKAEAGVDGVDRGPTGPKGPTEARRPIRSA